MSNMKARSLIRQRLVYAENKFAELVLWELPKPSDASPHFFKYRLAYVVNQVCVLRYDNEAGKGDHTAQISFTSPELLWKVLTAKRWDILKALCGAGPVSIRETGRRVGRDVKAVHRDVTALLAAGLLNKTEEGAIEFPYEAVKVEFLLEAA